MKKNILSLLFLVISPILYAQNSVTQSGYEVHYNALNSSFLSPEVAKNYHIPRSKTKGFLNIAIRKLNEDKEKLTTAVEADISISAKNFYGQKKEISLRKIEENDGAIYYIATFPVSSREMIKFNAQVRPNNSEAAIDIKFDKEFFTD